MDATPLFSASRQSGLRVSRSQTPISPGVSHQPALPATIFASLGMTTLQTSAIFSGFLGSCDEAIGVVINAANRRTANVGVAFGMILDLAVRITLLLSTN